MKDELIMSVISGRSSSRHSLRRNVGIGSSMHDFDRVATITTNIDIYAETER